MDSWWQTGGLRMDQPPITVELPDGSYPARLDDRGRLKLPTDFQRFFASLTEKKLFVTSLDRRVIRIYPAAVWRRNRALLTSIPQDQDIASDVLFTAYDLGANTEMDAQGRILIHEELRRALGWQNQPLRLVPWVFRIDVYTQADYEERRRQASENLDEKLRRLEAHGLK